MKKIQVDKEFARIKDYILANDQRSARILLNLLLSGQRQEVRAQYKETLTERVGLALIAGNYEDLHLGSVWEAAADIAEEGVPECIQHLKELLREVVTWTDDSHCMGDEACKEFKSMRSKVKEVVGDG